MLWARGTALSRPSPGRWLRQGMVSLGLAQIRGSAVCQPGVRGVSARPDSWERREGAQGQLSPSGVWLTRNEALPRRTLPNVTSLRKQYVIIVIIYFMNYFINVQFLEFE